jgi:hypothetical protein
VGFAVRTGLRVDNDVDEQPNDRPTLLVGKAGVEPRAQCLEQRFDRGQGSGMGYEGGDPAPDVRSRSLDPVELTVDLSGAEASSDMESDDTLSLLLEGAERSRQGDRLGLSNSRGRLEFACRIELVEDLAGVAQEALHVGPDPRFEDLALDRPTETRAVKRASLARPAAAPIPGGALATGRSGIGEATRRAVNDRAQQVCSTVVFRDDPVLGNDCLGGLPQGRGDERRNRPGDDLAPTLVGPPTVLLFAPIDRVDEEVSKPSRAPHAGGRLASDAAPVASVRRRDAETVEFRGQSRAGPMIERDSLVHPMNEPGRGAVSPQNSLIGHEAGRRPLTLDGIAERDDPPDIASLASCPLHAIGRALVEHPVLVLGERREEIEHKRGEPTLAERHDGDAELLEPSAGRRGVGELPPEPIESIQPQLVEPPRFRCGEERPATRSIGQGPHRADPVIGEAGDELDPGFGRQARVERVGLGLDRLAVTLILGAHPLVDRDPPGRHRHRSSLSLLRRTRGSPSTIRSAASMASRSGVHECSISTDLASPCGPPLAPGRESAPWWSGSAAREGRSATGRRPIGTSQLTVGASPLGRGTSRRCRWVTTAGRR